MAAPVLTVRQLPTGFKMPDGYRFLITFERKPACKFWEKTTKPLALDGGDPIKTSTQHNTKVHTKDARKLIDFDDQMVTCAYNPNFYSDIRGLINVNQSITHLWPDGATLVYFGYMRKCEFAELKEGEQPECTFTIVCTNWDPVNYLEVEPVFTPASGTP